MSESLEILLAQLLGWATGTVLGMVGYYLWSWPWWTPALLSCVGMAVPVVMLVIQIRRLA